ncbi:MAG: TRAP transporter small permease [Sphingomonadaceae bacterium]
MDSNAKLLAADLIEKVETAVAGVAMGVLLLAIFVDVFSRTVVGNPILWMQEVSMFSFMWLTFMGAAVAVRRNSHYRIDLIKGLLKSPRAVAALQWTVLLLSLVFAAILAYQGVGFAELGLKRVSRPSGIPLIIAFSALPLCGFSMCYFLVERFLKNKG